MTSVVNLPALELGRRVNAGALTAVEACDAGLVLSAATVLGRDLAPAVACSLKAGYAADATTLELRDGTLHVTRPVYAGKALATVTCSAERLVVGLRPNVFPVAATDGAAAPEVVALESSVAADGIRARVTQVAAAGKGRQDVAEADIVVAGGRGVGLGQASRS